MVTLKTIKLKKSPAAEAGEPAERPTELTAESSPASSAEAKAAPEMTAVAETPVAAPGRGRKMSDLVFALLAIAVAGCFVTLMILQGSEKSFYAAPPSLWTTGQ
jgi:hypothetical protein